MDLEDLSSRLRTEFKKAASAARGISTVIKVLFVAVGSGIVAIAQFVQVEGGESLSLWQVVGVAFSIIVATGAIFLAILEQDASERIVLAQDALERARGAEDLLEEAFNLSDMLEQVVSTLSSTMFMRTSL